MKLKTILTLLLLAASLSFCEEAVKTEEVKLDDNWTAYIFQLQGTERTFSSGPSNAGTYYIFPRAEVEEIAACLQEAALQEERSRKKSFQGFLWGFLFGAALVGSVSIVLAVAK